MEVGGTDLGGQAGLGISAVNSGDRLEGNSIDLRMLTIKSQLC